MPATVDTDIVDCFLARAPDDGCGLFWAGAHAWMSFLWTKAEASITFGGLFGTTGCGSSQYPQEATRGDYFVNGLLCFLIVSVWWPVMGAIFVSQVYFDGEPKITAVYKRDFFHHLCRDLVSAKSEMFMFNDAKTLVWFPSKVRLFKRLRTSKECLNRKPWTLCVFIN